MNGGCHLAIYCGIECEEAGPICDFCINYKDDNTNGKFQGEGVCTVKYMRVDACSACEDDFHCFQVK
ncbi:hypothetical protein D3C87_624630 [compost metagenome]